MSCTIDETAGATLGPPNLPREPLEAPCCWGSMLDGLHGCTCWIPIFDLDQAPPTDGIESQPPPERDTCCHDCAYRRRSPEEQAGERDWLESIARRPDQRFFCHQGVRRVVAFEHPVLNLTIPAGPGDYRPPHVGDSIVKADGSQGEICAGFAALRRAGSGS